MKKLIISVVILIIIFSCTVPTQYELIDENLKKKAGGHSLFSHSSFPSTSSVFVVGGFIMNRIKYSADIGKDSWENPKTTFKRGYGDCEDLAILFMNVFYLCTGIKTNLIIVDSSQARTIVDGGNVNHALVEINGRPFEVESCRYVDYKEIGYRFTFNEVFN